MFNNFRWSIACQTKGYVNFPKVFDLSPNSAQLYIPVILSEEKIVSARRAQEVRCP